MMLDLELMNDEKIRQFKRKSLQTIDDLLSQSSNTTNYTHYSLASINALESQTPNQNVHSSRILYTSSGSSNIIQILLYSPLESIMCLKIVNPRL